MPFVMMEAGLNGPRNIKNNAVGKIFCNKIMKKFIFKWNFRRAIDNNLYKQIKNSHLWPVDIWN